MQKDKYLINEKIREPRVLVVLPEGGKPSVMATRDAIRLAQDRGLDLVLFVPGNREQNKLAICKILDYGKFSYEQNKKQKEAKKNQVVVKTKEIQVKPQIGKGDLEWKSKQVNEWLLDGCQIRFQVRATGRMATKVELIQQVYQDFLKLIEANGKVVKPLKQVNPITYEATIVKK